MLYDDKLIILVQVNYLSGITDLILYHTEWDFNRNSVDSYESISCIPDERYCPA